MTASTVPFSASVDGPRTAPAAGHAESIVQRLERRTPHKPWGWLTTSVMGIASFGLLPMLVGAARFRTYVFDESQAYAELAKWARNRGRGDVRLTAAAERTVGSPFPFIVAAWASVLVVSLLVTQLSSHGFSGVPNLVMRTVAMVYGRGTSWTNVSPLPQTDFVHRVWVIALSIGFGAHWVGIRSHFNDVRAFCGLFNRVLRAERLPIVIVSKKIRPASWPLWVALAVGLATYDAWWGIPMALAGMAHNGYVRFASRRIRHELAQRVKDAEMFRPAPSFSLRCSNHKCLAPLRAEARFCARCGTEIMPLSRGQ